MAGKFRQYLSGSGGALLLGAGLTVGAIAVVFGGEHALSRTEFCVSCHSQTYPYEELKKIHALWCARRRSRLQGLPRPPGIRKLPSGPVDACI